MGTKINAQENKQINGIYCVNNQQETPEISKYKKQLVEAAKYLAENMTRRNVFDPSLIDGVTVTINNGIVTITASINLSMPEQQTAWQNPYGAHVTYMNAYGQYGEHRSSDAVRRAVACRIFDQIMAYTLSGAPIPALFEIMRWGMSSPLTVKKSIVTYVDKIIAQYPDTTSDTALYQMVYAHGCSDAKVMANNVNQDDTEISLSLHDNKK